MGHASRARGFTLIELLVTITIVAILVGAVVLNVEFRNVGVTMRDVARRTGLVMNLASDQAVYSRQQLGIRFHPNGYEFWILAENEGGGNEPGESTGDTGSKNGPTWQPIDDPRLTFRAPDVPVNFEVDISGVPIVLEALEDELAQASDSDPLKPHVLFLSNGELMPDFRIVLSDEEGEFRYQVATGEVDPIVVEQLDAP